MKQKEERGDREMEMEMGVDCTTTASKMCGHRRRANVSKRTRVLINMSVQWRERRVRGGRASWTAA